MLKWTMPSPLASIFIPKRKRARNSSTRRTVASRHDQCSRLVILLRNDIFIDLVFNLPLVHMQRR